MKTLNLVFPNAVLAKCRENLFAGDGSELFQMALARPCRRRKSTAFVVEQVIPNEAISYDRRNRGGLALSRKCSDRLNLLSVRAAAAGLVPVHLHSHPPGVNSFSPVDDLHERQLHHWLGRRGQPHLWSLIWPRDGQPVVRLWRNGVPVRGVIRSGLHPIGGDEQGAQPQALERQRAFGAGLRRAAANLRVAIVGVGGIGFPVAEQLARCGFEQFVLVDDDCIEESNMNRLPGTVPGDLGEPKVHVAKRLIEQAGRCIGTRPAVQACVQNVYTSRGRLHDRLRKCDLILALTDDELSRIDCLQLALEGGA